MISFKPPTQSGETIRSLEIFVISLNPSALKSINISAMSYGSLSKNAVLALSMGTKKCGFYHNTGEDGLNAHHLAGGGDLVWQLGTAYFGARDSTGKFNLEKFQLKIADHPQVKMIEIKISKGAKPGHGVILPPWHTAFDSPVGLVRFIAQLRELSGGKPIGFRLCVGKRREFFAICKAMIETGIIPDFITADGGEGGTGAAPLEFSNSIGTSLNEDLVVADKFKRVARFQMAPVKSFLEVMAAVGITHPDQISPWHIQRRISSLEVKHYGEIYDFLKNQELLGETLPAEYKHSWRNARSDTWDSPILNWRGGNNAVFNPFPRAPKSPGNASGSKKA